MKKNITRRKKKHTYISEKAEQNGHKPNLNTSPNPRYDLKTKKIVLSDAFFQNP